MELILKRLKVSMGYDVEFDISHHAILVVAGANTAKEEEIKGDIEYLDRIIGSGYYSDAEGDVLLQHIRDYLKNKLGGKMESK